MITIAIMFILAGIAIPLYSGYVREGHLVALRAEMNGLRTPIEDYRLENATYVGADANPGVAEFITDLNNGTYTFAVSPSTNTFDVTGAFNATTWVRCENRMNRCCDADKGDATISDCNFP
jgi:Tfp pilus assembly protein PilE